MRKIAVTLVFLLMLTGLPLGTAQADVDELNFTILHTNDEHSGLIPSPLTDHRADEDDPTLGGFARLAQAVEDIRGRKDSQGEPVLLVSAGDYLGGSPYAWLSLEGQAPELTLMRELGYDVVTIGNHEYDYGPDVLAEYLQAAGYPRANDEMALVASNTLPPEDHPLSQVGIQTTHVQQLDNGLKVGFFGLIGQEAISFAPLADPVEFADQVETAAAAIEELEQQDVDVVVAVTHSGEDEDVELAEAVPGIDVIVGGHAHTRLEQPIVEGDTIIVQAGSLLESLGMLELAYNPDTQQVRVRNADTGSPHLLDLDSSIDAQPAMESAVAEYTGQLNALISQMTDGRFSDISETVVRSDFEVANYPRLEETPFGNFATDAMRLVGQEVTGEQVDLSFQANGVLRGSIVPGSAPWSQQQVSFYDLANLVGLGSGPDGKAGYPMVSLYFTGQELTRIFEVQVLLAELMGNTYFLQMSGARMEYSPNRAILFTIPFLDLPIPTTMAVSSGELYTGEGIQDSDEFASVIDDDQQLYHVVTDYYIAAFLPLAGEMLPSLELVMKDKNGNPVELDDAIIYRDGQELKVWQAVMEYASAQPLDDHGNPRIAQHYAQTSDRLVQKQTLPLWVWLLVILAALVGLIVLLVKSIKKKQRNQRPLVWSK